MKYLIKFFIMMAVLCTVTACSQAFEDVSNNKKKQETTKGRLVMKVGSKSRTILPDISIVESDIKTARLTANGTEIKSWSGGGIIEQIENEDDILLDVGIYDFEMTFCNENGNVFLIGTIDNKEIKAGDNSLIFNMKLSQGNGNIAIGLSWEADCKISKIKAGLYDIATGEAVAGYEAEEIVINGTVAGYIKENVPSGQYIIKFELYDAADQLLNTLTEVIKVTVGKTTTEQKVLSNINTLYTITYNLNGGSWKSEFIPVTLHNTNTEINLPTADNVEKTNYALIGWYDENGNKVTQIPSNTAKDITMTAKWGYTANTVGAVIKALSGTGPHDITVTGAITIDTISSIKTALQNNSNKRINLDLSDTTGLTSIGDYAFRGCSSLTSVIIPDSVTSIGSSAFSECSKLTSIVIPDSVTTIGDNAFYKCSSLTSVHITDLTAWMNIKFEYASSNPLYNGADLYLNGSLVTDLVIPAGMTSIGKYAFYNCDSLESVTIPDSVTSIGEGAFSGCDNLEITINTDDKYLYSEDGTTILLCDSSVTSVTIPENVASINSGAFACCRNVETIETGDTLMSLSGLPITSALKSITIGNGVTSINENRFKNCSSLESVTIGDSVTSIGSCAFEGCSKLTSIVIPDSVTSIGSSAFKDCSKLTSVTIGNSVTSIRGSAFNGCSSLESVVIPDSVTSIGSSAFKDCSKLTSVVIGDSVTSIGDSAFKDCSKLTSVVIGDSVTSIGDGAFYYCSSLTNLRVDTNNPNYSSSDDGKILYNKGKTKLIAYPSATGDVTIPDSVTSIGKYAFRECSKLTNVTIPDSVTSIGDLAFYGCSSLTSVVIPDGVTSIGWYAFYYCYSLTSVTIGNSVTSIGNDAFIGCSSLIYNEYDNELYLGNADNPYLVFVEAKDRSITSCEINNRTKIILYNAFDSRSSLTSVVIPDSVTSIGCNAFHGCSKLTSVTIGNGVTSIGDWAFHGCSSLTTVNYKGTQEQWGQISIDNDNGYLTDATINYNYSGE